MAVSGALKLGFSILVATRAARLESEVSVSLDLDTEQAVDTDADMGDILAAARKSRAELANWVAINESAVSKTPPNWGASYHSSAPPTPFRLSSYPRGELLMYWNGEEFPVCGHEFKYSHAGAAHVCREMGYTGGVIHFHKGWKLEKHALFVGKCLPGEVPGVNCSGGDPCGPVRPPAMSCDKCNKGEENVVEVECFTHPFKEGEVILYPSWGDNGFVEGELQIFRFGHFHPVCSAGFLSNHNGANLACQAMGYQLGHAVPPVPELGGLEKDALMVGACPGGAWDFSHCRPADGGDNCQPNGMGCDKCKHGMKSETVVRCATQGLKTYWVGHRPGHDEGPENLTPGFTYPTQTFVDAGWSSSSSTGHKHPNLARRLPRIDGHLTMAFTVRFDEVDSWSRVVDIGNPETGSYTDHADDIYVCRNMGKSEIEFGMTVSGTPYSVTAAIDEQTEHKFLWSVARDGTWKLWKDGKLVVETNQHAPGEAIRSVAYLGKSTWGFDPLFRGEVKDFKLWAETLSWERVFGGAAPVYAKDASVVTDPRYLDRGYTELFPFSAFETMVAGSRAIKVQNGRHQFQFYAFPHKQPGTFLFTIAKDKEGNSDVVEGDGADLPDDVFSEKMQFWAYD